MRAKPYSELRSRMPAAARQRAQARARAMLAEIDVAATGKQERTATESRGFQGELPQRKRP